MNAGERAIHNRTDGDPSLNGAGLITSYTPPTASFKLDNSNLIPYKVDVRDLMTEEEAEGKGIL